MALLRNAGRKEGRKTTSCIPNFLHSSEDSSTNLLDAALVPEPPPPPQAVDLRPQRRALDALRRAARVADEVRDRAVDAPEPRGEDSPVAALLLGFRLGEQDRVRQGDRPLVAPAPHIDRLQVAERAREPLARRGRPQVLRRELHRALERAIEEVLERGRHEDSPRLERVDE